MAATTDCAEGRHEVCRGAGPNHYFPQTAEDYGDQPCACRCHAANAGGIASEGETEDLEARGYDDGYRHGRSDEAHSTG